ncbi:MAG: hypothetical protein IKE73_01070 [Bacilli bacterium]|nr:hypothetical protein [Bacilli bacterium]
MKEILLNKEMFNYRKLKATATQSRVFLANNLIYKILNEKDEDILKGKEEKIELFNEFNEEYMLDIDSKIMDENGIFRGFTSKYIKGKSLKDSFDKKDLLIKKKVLLTISKDLERFHRLDGRPVFGDLHFSNILLDNNYLPHFLDVDSYGIGKHKADNVPFSFYTYCDYMNYKLEKNQNTDRINYFLSIIHMMFDKSLLSVSAKEFDDLSEEYKFLRDLKDVFMDLKSSYGELPDIPYIHTLVR